MKKHPNTIAAEIKASQKIKAQIADAQRAISEMLEMINNFSYGDNHSRETSKILRQRIYELVMTEPEYNEAAANLWLVASNIWPEENLKSNPDGCDNSTHVVM